MRTICNEFVFGNGIMYFNIENQQVKPLKQFQNVIYLHSPRFKPWAID